MNTQLTLEQVPNATTEQLVAFYNEHSGKRPIKKFADRGVAVKRIQEVFKALSEPTATAPATQPVAETPATPTAVQTAVEGAVADTKKNKKELSAEAKAKKDEAKAKHAADVQKGKDARAKDKAERKAKREAEAAERKANPKVKVISFRGEPIEDKIHSVRSGSKVAKIIDLIARPEGATMAELQPLMSAKATVRGILSYDVRTLCGYGFVSEDGNVVKILLPKGMKAPLAHAVAESAKPKEPKPAKAPKPEKVAAPKAEGKKVDLTAAPAPSTETPAPKAEPEVKA